MSLNNVEANALDTLRLVRDYCGPTRKIGRIEFVDMMDKLRTAIFQLENKKAGCKTGRHESRCSCL